MPKLRKIELDGREFHGAPAVVRYLQAKYGHGTDIGLRGAIDRGASTYLGHAIFYQHKSDVPASTSAPNVRKGPEYKGFGRPPLLRIRH